MDVIKKLGPVELLRCGLSYLWAAIKPKGREDTFEQWVSNRFGKRLYNHFFKTYTEKVWGVSTLRAPRRVGRAADQGPVVLQRRQGRVLRQQGQQDQVADLRVQLPALRPRPDVGADDRRHPRAGRRGAAERAGHAAARSRTAACVEVVAGGETLTPVARDLLAAAAHDGRHRRARGAGRRARRRPRPALPRLPHRRAGHRRRGPVPRQLDLHPRAGRAGRADPELPLLEPVDGAQRHRRLDRHGVLLLRGRRAVEHGRRRSRQARHPRARAARPGPGRARSSSASSCASTRPIRCTTPSTASASTTIRAWLDGIANLQQVGRNGLHRYNNSDHSMLTAMRAVDNILLGTHHDIWAVNAESVYHEEDVGGRAALPRTRRRRPRWSSRSRRSGSGAAERQ